MNLTEAYRTCLKIEDELPGAVIFGGFWRDILLDRSWTDIDVALPANVIRLEDLGFEMQSDPHLDYDHDYIHATWRRGDINICEIASHVSPEGQNKYVDIGLCAVAWDRYQGLVIDNAFLTDVANQTLTVRRTDWGEEGVQAHLARLKKKYPEFREVWL